MADLFTAAPQALGYLFQVRYALLLLLRRGREDPGAELSIERFDDIAFERYGTPEDLLQTKHHVGSKGSLSDASTDLWKTLRAWSTGIFEGTFQADSCVFTIVTTATAPENSACSKLRPVSMGGRDTVAALDVLLNVTTTSTSEANAPAYNAFRRLSALQQQTLIENLQILDSSPDIIDCYDNILQELKYSARPKHLEAVCERIEGWWIKTVIQHLTQDSLPGILHSDLQAKLNDIQEQFHPDSLPIDYPNSLDVQENDLAEDERIFVEQLRLVAVGPVRVRKSMSDFYRASAQRSKWVRELLVSSEDLGLYEDRLIDEWERRYEMMKEGLSVAPSDEELKTSGRNLFNDIDDENYVIRRRCTDPYISRGSFHILANQLRVGWHRDYFDRLKAHLSPVMKGTQN
jgi:hypothetical protein